MGRQRNKQNQTARIYYRERDHREVIMDDSYHGAMYLPEQVEPVWRKYKPRLVLGAVLTSTSVTYTGAHLVSVDVENKYFTMLTNFQTGYYDDHYLIAPPTSVILIPNKDIIWIYGVELVDQARTEYGGYGMLSKDGYDWKPLGYWPLPPGVYNYGQRYQCFGDGHFIFDDQTGLYSVYDLDYLEGEKIATIRYLGSVPRDYSYGYSIAPINTSQYSGYISYKNNTTSVRRSGTYYYTYKYDLNVYDYLSSSWINIYHKDGPANVEQSQQAYVDRMYDVLAVYYLNDQIFFIAVWYVRSQTTGMQNQRFVCVHSSISDISLNSWVESEFCSHSYYPTPSSSADVYLYSRYFITVRNNKAFLYMMRHLPNDVYTWDLFISSNLDNWERVDLPEYLDIPFFKNDNSDGRYGVVVESSYDYVRIPISSTGIVSVPSNVLLATEDNVEIFGANMGFWAYPHGNGDPRSDDLWFEILDGKIVTNPPTEDLWLFDVCPNTVIYIDNMTFSESPNNCAYAIYEPHTIETSEYYHYNIRPYKEPIDESDYIFN